jgi:hypothetical protein
MRSNASLLVLSILGSITLGCAGSHERGRAGGDDLPMTPAPSGDGVCCPRGDSPCNGPDTPSGGWAPRAADCADHTLGAWDGSWDFGTDSHGCAIWIDRYITRDADICCGCPPLDAGPPEDARPEGAASLDGDYACGAFTCGTGEVCVTHYPGADTGMGAVARCQPAPEACELHDCNDSFGARTCCGMDSTCAREICHAPACAPGGGWGGVGVSGRTVECYGI